MADPALFLSEIDRSVAVAVELIANWTPLERKLPPELCAEFMWMYRENGVEHFKHIVTRRYLRLDQDSRCLVCTDDGPKEVPFEQEWRRVTGRTGGTEIDALNGTVGRRENERSETDRPQKGLKTSRRAAVTQPGDGNPIFCRSARRGRRQTHTRTRSGKRAGGPRDRV